MVFFNTKLIMKINIKIKHVYGRDLYYVSDNSQADSLRRLTKSETLTESHIKALTELGHTISVETPTLTFDAKITAKLNNYQ